MNRCKLITIGIILLASGSLYAQTAALQGYCDRGSTQAVTSGLASTTTLQGIVPGGNNGCLINVYLTGTTIPATIYSNTTNGVLPNPFRADLSGHWIFWAAINQGFDVIGSSGNPPNYYPQPKALCTACYVGFAFSGAPTVIEVNGVPTSPVSPVNFVDSATVTWSLTGATVSATAVGGGGSGGCSTGGIPTTNGSVTGDTSSTNCGYNNRTDDTAGADAQNQTFGANLLDTNSGTDNVAMGIWAGDSNTGSINVFIGDSAGEHNSGTAQVCVGNDTCAYNEGGDVVAIGQNAGGANPFVVGNHNSARFSNFIGSNTGWQSSNLTPASATGNYLDCMGYNSCRDMQTNNDYIVGIGAFTADGNSGGDIVGIGNASGTGHSGSNIVGIGDGAGSGSNGDAQVSGDNIIGIGNGAGSGNGNDVIGIGRLALKTWGGHDLIAIGDRALTFGLPNGQIAYATVSTSGSGQTLGTYTVPVTDVGGPGTGATVSITVNSSGTVNTNPVLLAAGSGYLNPVVNFGGHGGTQALFRVALVSGVTGSEVIAIGDHALVANVTGSNNVVMGQYAGANGWTAGTGSGPVLGNANLTGSNNTWIGDFSGPNTTSQLSNTTALGYQAENDASNQIVLGNSSVTQFRVPAIKTVSGIGCLQTDSSGNITNTGSGCGGGGGSGTVTSFAAPSGGWPTWLVPTVVNSSTTPSLSVAASAIPNSALANSSITINTVSCTLGSSCTISGGGAVSSVANSDGTLTISPTTGSVVASLALTHANTWTGKQTQPAPLFSDITGSTQCLHVNTSGQVSGTGSDCGSGGGGTPGGSNTQIQYNNSGVFGGSNLTWDGTTLGMTTGKQFFGNGTHDVGTIYDYEFDNNGATLAGTTFENAQEITYRPNFTADVSTTASITAFLANTNATSSHQLGKLVGFGGGSNLLGSGNFNEARGMDSSASMIGNGSGNALFGVDTSVGNFGTGTIGWGAGITIQSGVNGGAGSITLLDGLYIYPQLAGVTSHNIFSAGATTHNVFEGDLTVNGVTVTGTTHGIVIPAGTPAAGAAGSVVYASDATSGFAEVNENNTGLSRVCTVLNGLCAGGGGSGTVTSVAQTVPSWLAVGGSPVTTTGTLAITAATGQTSHQVLGTCGTATSFAPCALTVADLPALPLYLNWTFNTGAAATDAAPRLLASHASSISNCYVLTTASDGATALTLNIFDNGTSIFSGGAQTVAAGTAAGTLTTLGSLTSTPLSIANNDKLSVNITSGTSSWIFTVQCK